MTKTFKLGPITIEVRPIPSRGDLEIEIKLLTSVMFKRAIKPADARVLAIILSNAADEAEGKVKP